MSVISHLFGKSPFGPLVEHTAKVHDCVAQVRPLMEACIREDCEEVHRLQDHVSRLEYEADQIKHEIRENLVSRYFMPVDRSDLEDYLHSQDEIADHAQDFSVILLIRRTKIHPALVQEFRDFVDHILKVSDTLMVAAQQIQALAEASFSGAEAKAILQQISGLNEGEWMADRMQRKISQHIYALEKELDPVTISFYEKMLRALSGIANAVENTGDHLREMIVKG